MHNSAFPFHGVDSWSVLAPVFDHYSDQSVRSQLEIGFSICFRSLISEFIRRQETIVLFGGVDRDPFLLQLRSEQHGS